MTHPTHNTLDHFRALIIAKRRLIWSRIKPISSALAELRYQPVRNISGRAY